MPERPLATTTIELNDIDKALATAAPTLDATEQRVAVAIYRTLSHGQPATTSTIAAAAGTDVGVVERLLDSWSAVFRDDHEDVIGFWGLATVDTPHRLRVRGIYLYAWCAWDPLFLAPLIGPMNVSTDDPQTGETITYRLDGDGVIHDLSHPESVLSFLRPDRAWDDQVMATFCHYVGHFTSTATAETWTARHDGTFILDVDDGVDLAQRHITRTFDSAI